MSIEEIRILLSKQEFRKVPCQLVGQDGNAYSILGKVGKALKNAGHKDLAELYYKEATAGDYDHLLSVSLEFVEDTEE